MTVAWVRGNRKSPGDVDFDPYQPSSAVPAYIPQGRCRRTAGGQRADGSFTGEGRKSESQGKEDEFSLVKVESKVPVEHLWEDVEETLIHPLTHLETLITDRM